MIIFDAYASVLDKVKLLQTGHIRKSVSADVNYGIRFTNDQEMYKFTQELSTEVSRRMEEIQVSY